MGVQTSIERIENARNTIRTALVGMGFDASDGKLDELAEILAGIQTVEQATPGITVSSSGLITASATQSGGLVAAGTKSATQQLTTKGATTVTPTSAVQTIVNAGTYVTGAIKVAASTGKAVYSGTHTFTGNNNGSFTLNLGVTLSSNDTFIMIHLYEGLKYSTTCFVSALKNSTYSQTMSSSSDGGNTTITYSGTNVTVNTNVYKTHSYIWYLIKG